MTTIRTTAALVCLITWTATVGWAADDDATKKHPSARWEPAIARFEAADKKSPPPTGAVLFVGSSSIRMWDLDEWFPELRTINRGFGGSETADALYFADRIVLPYKPRVIVLYAGDNDIAKGKSPETVANDYRKFAALVHKELPETKIVYIAIKPSVARWKLVEKMRDANERIKKMTEKDDQAVFVDIDTPMLGDDRQPRQGLFMKDGLHMNNLGYKIWSDLVRPHLQPQTK